MAAWDHWFDLIAEIQVDRGGLRNGREITPSETRTIPFTENSITGYTIIKADNLDEAEKIAAECPVVNSTRIYEVQKG